MRTPKLSRSSRTGLLLTALLMLGVSSAMDHPAQDESWDVVAAPSVEQPNADEPVAETCERDS